MSTFGLVVYIVAYVVWDLAIVAWAAFLITFLYEREWRAVAWTLLLSGISAGTGAALLFLDYPAKTWILLGLLILGLVLAILLLTPGGRNRPIRIVTEQERIDERDAVFHRFYRLRPGSPEFEAYYAQHPEKREFDDEVRTMPELAEPGSKTYDPLTSPFQVATFDTLERITRDIEWTPCPLGEKPVETSPGDFARRIKGFARYLGADLVGTTRLNPAYVYSHVGRSPGPWGEAIRPDHTHAVAIAVEMSYEMVRHAPGGATTTETAKQYFEAAKIALQLARYINVLGYEARAHIDANYRVMCVPVAVDAGLGELGRLGVLITPRFGPRIRLAVVTTNLALPQDSSQAFGAREFCEICLKCADICPSGSVDSREKALYAGVEKWQTRRDTCYRMWRTCGSDCNLCVKVCPYSNPSSPVHNGIRWAIRRSPLARQLALWGDSLFYGSDRGSGHGLPDWHKTWKTRRGVGEEQTGQDR